MASKKLTRREVIELLFSDSDSEGENLTLGDDGQPISELASCGEFLHSKGGAVQSKENAQAQDPLPNIGGSGNDRRTHSISRVANRCGRSSGGGENSAGNGISVHSFYHDGHVAARHGSGVAMRRSSFHEAPSTRFSQH